MEITEFLKLLSSSEPAPGGGGASALTAALSSALCSMAANLTSGKKKYADYQKDIEQIIKKTENDIAESYSLIKKDEEAFLPLSKAYSIPKDAPGRDETLENALLKAAEVPLEILDKAYETVEIIEKLSQKASKLVISDVGVAAAMCIAAAKGAAMNVYINTKLMKDRVRAEKINSEADFKLGLVEKRCSAVYDFIAGGMKD